MAGKVWLVGAGPSDVSLMTVKGKQVLEQAQVVVYDALIGLGILGLIPKEAELINVGKRSGHHTMKQEDISQILVKKALEGKRVVRLKGGDPFLFGRGGEEMEFVKEHGITCEVVPGVTSAISVPAYNGIPVTHRDFSSSLHIITAHKRKGEPLDIDFASLVKMKGTLVFLMGVTALGDICMGLIKAGMKEDTPAAILQQGTTARQKKVVATVATLKEEALKENIQSPAVIVVGAVCTMAEKLSWYEDMELSGKRILITRPRHLISGMARRLREKGAEVLEVPAVSIVPCKDTESFQNALDRLSEYTVLAFTSPSGVQVFFRCLKLAGVDIRKLSHLKIAAIGKGTAKELEERGIFVDYMPKVYDAASLGKLLCQNCSAEDIIFLPRAANGNPELVEEAVKSGAKIVELPIYDTVYEKDNVINLTQEIQHGTIDYVIFTSASTVKSFTELVEPCVYDKVQAVCIGRKTEEAAKSYGMQTFVSKEATMESVVEKLEELEGNGKQKG